MLTAAGPPLECLLLCEEEESGVDEGEEGTELRLPLGEDMTRLEWLLLTLPPLLLLFPSGEEPLLVGVRPDLYLAWPCCLNE